tara:strand:+ start:194 stop:988 length:795 start_codon:yes stop_codon:yes gene_type:complete
MYLKEIINKSIYGGMGYISSQNDLDTLEKYILYNLPVIKEYKQVIVATNYKNYPELTEENTQLWKKYFPDCIIIDSKINRGHSHGYTDLENLLFDWCKENNEEWLCKVSNDIIIQEKILDKKIDEADFYYLNGIGYGGMIQYNFDFNRIINENFYPQGNFYFINVSKCDFISDKIYLDETYEYIKSISDYNGKAWEYGFKSCEALLAECVERNNLLKYHLVPQEKYLILLKLIKDNHIHDPSHKNIMIEGICHFHYNNKQIIQI